MACKSPGKEYGCLFFGAHITTPLKTGTLLRLVASRPMVPSGTCMLNLMGCYVLICL